MRSLGPRRRSPGGCYSLSVVVGSTRPSITCASLPSCRNCVVFAVSRCGSLSTWISSVHWWVSFATLIRRMHLMSLVSFIDLACYCCLREFLERVGSSWCSSACTVGLADRRSLGWEICDTHHLYRIDCGGLWFTGTPPWMLVWSMLSELPCHRLSSLSSSESSCSLVGWLSTSFRA